MANDVAPSLLEAIQKQFQKAYNADTQIKAILERFDKGQGNYQDAQKYAIRVGEILSSAYSSNLSSDVLPDGRMYYNIATRILQPTLEKNYNLISQVSQIAQNQVNQNANIGLKAIKASLNQDRIDGIVNRVSSEPKFDDVAWILQSPINNFSQNVVDDTIEANASFHYKSGRSPVIRRIATGKCCEWCSNLAGVYPYPDDVPDDIYRRHENCRCLVTYDPRDGNNRVQNVHDKLWKKMGDYDNIFIEANSQDFKKPAQRIIETAMQQQLLPENKNKNILTDVIIEHHEVLKYYTPESMFEVLTETGYEVRPLSQGNYKGVEFKNGGGYKINFGGDGIFQYHPKKRSHHGGEYWKVGSGKVGIIRYDRQGRIYNESSK